MRIGLNLLYLLPGQVGGTQTYAEELCRALVGLGDGNEYVAYVNRESAGLELGGGAVELRRCEVTAASRGRRYVAEQTRLPAWCRRDGIDVLHSLGYVGPVRPGLAHVVTVHDLIYRGFADHLGLARRLALRTFVRGAARGAHAVITDSEASRASLVAELPVPPDRIHVVHLAPRSGWSDSPSRPIPPHLIDAGVRGPYVLALGSASPSKNLPSLVRAFARLNRPDLLLVLAGHLPADGEIAEVAAHEGCDERVVCTGYVDDGDLESLFAGATVFAFPSTYEGFGLPVLDAQRSGVPVVCSSAASVPEVAGEGAVVVDPGSVDAIAAGLDRVLDDGDERRRLVAAGRRNLERFSWERTARATSALYSEAHAAHRERGRRGGGAP